MAGANKEVCVSLNGERRNINTHFVSWVIWTLRNLPETWLTFEPNSKTKIKPCVAMTACRSDFKQNWHTTKTWAPRVNRQIKFRLTQSFDTWHMSFSVVTSRSYAQWKTSYPKFMRYFKCVKFKIIFVSEEICTLYINQSNWTWPRPEHELLPRLATRGCSSYLIITQETNT